MFKNYELWTPRISGGIIYILAGILIMIYPGMTGLLFANIISAMTLFYGLYSIVKWVRNYNRGISYKSDLVLGIIIAVLGAVMLFNTPWVMAFMPIVAGGLLIADAVIKIPAAVAVYKNYRSSLIGLILATILPAVLGIMMLINPMAGFAAMVTCFGAFMAAVGIMDIISIAIINRAIKKEMQVQ